MKKTCFVVFLCFFFTSVVFGQYHGASGRMEELGFFIFRPDSFDTFENEAVSLELLDTMAAVLSSRNLTPGQIHVFGYSAIALNEVNPTLLAYNRAIFIINELTKRGISWDLFAPPMGYGAVVIWGSAQQFNRRATVNMAETFPIDSAGSRFAEAGTVSPGTTSPGTASPGTTSLGTASPGTAPTGTVISGNSENQADIEKEHFDILSDRIEKLEAESKRIITGWFVGIGPEFNSNSDRISFAVGGYVSGGIEFMYRYVLGLRIGYFTDRFSYHLADYFSNYKSNPAFYSDVDTFEAALLFRYNLPFKGVFSGLYVEGFVGMSSFRRVNINTNNMEARPAPLGGISAGWRFVFFKHWYVEPSARFGSPFTWGAGLVTGIKF